MSAFAKSESWICGASVSSTPVACLATWTACFRSLADSMTICPLADLIASTATEYERLRRSEARVSHVSRIRDSLFFERLSPLKSGSPPFSDICFCLRAVNFSTLALTREGVSQSSAADLLYTVLTARLKSSASLGRETPCSASLLISSQWGVAKVFAI